MDNFPTRHQYLTLEDKVKYLLATVPHKAVKRVASPVPVYYHLPPTPHPVIVMAMRLLGKGAQPNNKTWGRLPLLHAIALFLLMLRKREAVPVLHKYAFYYLHSGAQGKFLRVMRMLKRLGKDAILPIYREMSNERATFREPIIAAVQGAGDKRAVPHLVSALKSDSNVGRYFAARAIESIDPAHYAYLKGQPDSLIPTKPFADSAYMDYVLDEYDHTGDYLPDAIDLDDAPELDKLSVREVKAQYDMRDAMLQMRRELDAGISHEDVLKNLVKKGLWSKAATRRMLFTVRRAKARSDADAKHAQESLYKTIQY